MKKLLLFLAAIAITFGLKAQCPLTQAVDFTATDVHGTEVHLFDILDGGQYVLIDFFFTTCGPCQQATPKIVESYYAMGCNMHDVFYMEIATGDSDAACLTWVATYGVEYPTISGAAGGTGICNQYGIGAYPTVILIAPDHSIVIQDLWPITNAQTVIAALEAQGLEQHSCDAPAYNPQVSITIDQVTENEITATFTPNEDCAVFYYLAATEAEVQEWMVSTGLPLPEVVQQNGLPGEEEISQTFMGLMPNTEYLVLAVAADPDGNLSEAFEERVTTTPGGGSETIVDFTGITLDGEELNLYSILDAGQAVLINFFLTDDPYSMAPMPFITESFRLFGCNKHDVFYMEICPNGHDEACQQWAQTYGVEYPTISRDGGGNDIVQSIPVGLYPTVMIINPDHTIAYRDVYPLESTQTIVDALESIGMEQHDCLDETLTFSTDTIDVNWMELTWITVYNNTAQDAVVDTIFSYILSYTLDGTNFFSTLRPMEFTIPQGESIELGLFCDAITKDVFWDDVTLTGNFPDASFVAKVNNLPWSVEENKNPISLFPNPANESVTLKGANLGTVCVYNTLGQKVEVFVTEGVELTINTAKYENGIYVVKTDSGTTARFVVKH